ncbi:MAG: hypothetical protein ACRDVE_03080, partial [Actinocrinis sp.]
MRAPAVARAVQRHLAVGRSQGDGLSGGADLGGEGRAGRDYAAEDDVDRQREPLALERVVLSLDVHQR